MIQINYSIIVDQVAAEQPILDAIITEEVNQTANEETPATFAPFTPPRALLMLELEVAPALLMLEPAPEVAPVAPPRKRRKNLPSTVQPPSIVQQVALATEAPSSDSSAFTPNNTTWTSNRVFAIPEPLPSTSGINSSRSSTEAYEPRPSRIRKTPSTHKDFVPTIKRKRSK